MSSPFSGSLRAAPKAPDLGSFPLDHYRECKGEIEQYYKCLIANNYVIPLCRDPMKDYLTCRMEKGLMKQADVSAFGIPDTEFVPTRQHKLDIRKQLLQQKMEQVTPVWHQNYKVEDTLIPDGFERAKDGSVVGNTV